jgi:hypothetical protein
MPEQALVLVHASKLIIEGQREPITALDNQSVWAGGGLGDGALRPNASATTTEPSQIVVRPRSVRQMRSLVSGFHRNPATA